MGNKLEIMEYIKSSVNYAFIMCTCFLSEISSSLETIVWCCRNLNFLKIIQGVRKIRPLSGGRGFVYSERVFTEMRGRLHSFIAKHEKSSALNSVILILLHCYTNF